MNIMLHSLIERLKEIESTEKFCGASVTGKKINDIPCLVIQGNKEYLCIELGELE